MVTFVALLDAGCASTPHDTAAAASTPETAQVDAPPVASADTSAPAPTPSPNEARHVWYCVRYGGTKSDGSKWTNSVCYADEAHCARTLAVQKANPGYSMVDEQCTTLPEAFCYDLTRMGKPELVCTATNENCEFERQRDTSNGFVKDATSCEKRGAP